LQELPKIDKDPGMQVAEQSAITDKIRGFSRGGQISVDRQKAVDARRQNNW